MSQDRNVPWDPMKAFGGSSFGAQPASTRATAPAHGFGTGVREQIEKIYLSKEHAKYIVPDVPAPMHVTEHALGRQHLSYKRTAPAYAFARADRFAVSSSWSGANIPGPGAYTVGSSIGPQVDATRASRPRYGFGKNSRSIDHRLWVSAEYNATFIGRQSPAADYNIRTALGTQPEARRRSAPSWQFPRSERFRYPHMKRAVQLPGPGEYEASSMIGQQRESRRASEPMHNFTRATREQESKVILTNPGKESPGPQAYAHSTTSLGTQRESVKRSNPMWRFGTGDRFNAPGSLLRADNGVPGPGAYSGI